MGRDSDRVARQRRIAEAVCALAGEIGLDAVTVRDVAARAGVSAPAVQRCFGTKDEMLLFALAHVGDRIRARARSGDPAGLVAAVALLDEEHQGEARVWLAFVARAAVTPALAEVLRRDYAELAGHLSADATQARTLLALADGLTMHVLIGRLTAEEAAAILHRAVSSSGAS